jgi:hypothetical protein
MHAQGPERCDEAAYLCFPGWTEVEMPAQGPERCDKEYWHAYD